MYVRRKEMTEEKTIQFNDDGQTVIKVKNIKAVHETGIRRTLKIDLSDNGYILLLYNGGDGRERMNKDCEILSSYFQQFTK